MKYKEIWPSGEGVTRLSAKQLCAGSNPTWASKKLKIGNKGPVAELAYAHDLKSCPVRDVGSTPTWTISSVEEYCWDGEMADALALGASGSNPMGVQVSLPA